MNIYCNSCGDSLDIEFEASQGTCQRCLAYEQMRRMFTPADDGDNELDFDDDPTYCDKCGEEVEWVDCSYCGGEGGTDGDELVMEDPLWYSEDDYRRCDACKGKGAFPICECK